jgi:uncharacterized membrane protein
MQLGLASPHRLNWRRALLRLWLLLSVGWITGVTAWITWDAFAEYERFDTDRTMQAWEVEFATTPAST